MILKRSYYNNGYGCSCCRQDWEETNWIREDEAESFEKIVMLALRRPLEGCVGIQFEKKGKILYGFKIKIYKAGGDYYVFKNDKKLMIYSSIGNENKKKKEILEYFKNIEKEIDE